MKVLAITNMYPYEENPHYGIFVKEQLERLETHGVEIDVLFINGQRSKLNYLKGVFEVRRKVKENNYDLVHAHYVFCGYIARFQGKYPIVLTHHGIEVLRSYQAPLSRFISPLVDRVIVRSDEMRDALQRVHPYIIPAGVDLDLFKPEEKEVARRKLQLPVDKKLVLFAGTIRPEKRFHLIEKAVGRLKEEDPDVELVAACKQPHSVIPSYMNACDVLVLVSTAEGSPNVIKEAMACNLPIVSTNVGDVSHVFGTTKGCYICSASPESIAESVRKALSFGRRTEGRTRLLELGLSSKQATEKIIRVYEDVLGIRGRDDDEASDLHS